MNAVRKDSWSKLMCELKTWQLMKRKIKGFNIIFTFWALYYLTVYHSVAMRDATYIT